MFTVITTTYNGNGYLPKLFSMIEANTLSLQKVYPDMQVEYLLVNDSPWEELALPKTEGLHFQCRTITNPENYGIHKSRAVAIREASGDLITMLDQDDQLAGDFLLSQYEALGDGDAVICNGIKEFDTGNKAIYRDKLKMSLINCKCFYLKAANQIVSPGQCLMRKSAVPEKWLDNPLTVNGSDDLFLWLLMLDQGTRFVKNPKKLYTHKQVGNNLSNSLRKMCRSDLQMCRLMRQKQLMQEKDIHKRERLCAFLERCGYRNRPVAATLLRYADIMLLKFFAYYI